MKLVSHFYAPVISQNYEKWHLFYRIIQLKMPLQKNKNAPEMISPNCASTCFLMLLWFPHRGFGLLAGLSLSAHGFHPSHIGLEVGYFFLKLVFLSELFMQQFCRLAIEK